MDQNSTGGTDKRNWRERLGINNTRDGMPRVSDELNGPAPVQPAAAPARPVVSGVRPAPMAPRPAPRATPAPAAPVRQPPIAPDALANKLRSQRDAAEKLAEQRVSAAKQRAEAQLGPATKPKFSFADDDAPPAKAVIPPPQVRPVAPPPVAPAPIPQMQPPRPQLGQGGSFRPVPPPAQPSYAQPPQPRNFAPQQPYPPQPQVPYPQQQYAPQPPPQQFQPNQGYRPIDPNTGYTPPPGYNPYQAPLQPQPPRGNFQPQPQQQPPMQRMQPPPRLNPAPGFGAEAPTLRGPRLNPPMQRPTPQVAYDDGEDEIFEQPAPQPARRATATDYQQAYREQDVAFGEDAPRSRLPLVLMTLLALALAAGLGGVWAYNHLIKTSTVSSANAGSAPVVAAPDQPAKVTPDAAAPAKTDTGQTATPVAPANKKQIYDRIVGDHEVLSGQMKATEETPVQPDANAAPPAPGTGNDGTPLPLPPPPGTGGGTQGSLESDKTSNVADATPAAEPSSAANSTVAPIAAPPTKPSALETSTEIVPAPPAKTTADAGIVDKTETPKAAAKPAMQDNEAKKSAPKAEKSLGSKPVVLVPPSKFAVAQADTPKTKSVPEQQQITSTENSLYNGPAVGGASTTPAPAPAKKRKSLTDLFKSNQDTTPSAPAAVATAPVASGAYVAQLASFNSKAEASAEYSRLVQKHGAIVSRYAPIIETANVAGSTRYRLNIGPMATQDVANGICSSLFSAGERDCIVHRQ